MVLLAFGIAPLFPPAIVVGGGILLSTRVLLLLPRWTAHPDWGDAHQFATIFGVILGSMLSSFVGFIGSLQFDLCFKIGVDAPEFFDTTLADGSTLRGVGLHFVPKITRKAREPFDRMRKNSS